MFPPDRKWWTLTLETPGWAEPAPMRYVRIPAQRSFYYTAGMDPMSWDSAMQDFQVFDTGLPILNVEDLKRAVALLYAEPIGNA